MYNKYPRTPDCPVRTTNSPNSCDGMRNNKFHGAPRRSKVANKSLANSLFGGALLLRPAVLPAVLLSVVDGAGDGDDGTVEVVLIVTVVEGTQVDSAEQAQPSPALSWAP